LPAAAPTASWRPHIRRSPGRPDLPRKHDFELEIDAPPEAVWDAIATADGLRSWFVEDARVEPGEGGSVWYSWGGDMAGEATIEVWEPGGKLGLRDSSMAADVELVEEWEIATRGGKTLLRFVHANIPDSSDWDGMYDSTERGWEIFFATLRHYVERHPGEPRRTIYTMNKLPQGDEGLWERLTRPDAPIGSLAGEVLVSRPGQTLLAVAPSLDDGLVALSHEGASMWVTVSAYGGARDRLDALEPAILAEIPGEPI
jgi:uncharacterized protein YndB with AHSA1/START domain